MELSTTYPEQSHLLASVAGSSVAGEAFAAEAKGNYPKTPHLPFSPDVNSDDSKLADCGTLLAAGEVVVTEKLDGGNCCIKGGQVYSRTHSQPATHESFSAVKTLAAEFAASLGEVELYGENLQAIHSIEYGNLASYFYVFAARRQGTWLSWDEVERVASDHGLQLVPLVFRGSFASAEQLQRSFEAWAKEPSAVGSSVTPEGFVVRHAGQIAADKFRDCVGKYVRAGHIQTDDSWRRRWKKATLGPALHPRALRLLEDPLYAKLKDPRQRHMVKVSCLGREVPLPRNFSFIVEDVAVSSTPKNREQIIAMASLGITLVVTLTEETPLPADWFHGTGVHNLFVPVENYHPPSLNQADSILDDFARVIQSQSKVMVHCGGGKGRAGTVAACMLLRYGINGVGAALQLEQASDGGATCHCHMQSDEVITYLREARPGSVETKHQERFIREYASVLWRRAAEAPGPLPVLQRQLSRQRSQIEEDSLVQAELFDGSQLAFPSSNSNNNSNNNNNNNNNKNTNNNSNNHNNFSSSCAAASGSAPSSGPGFVPPERRKAPAAASRAEKDHNNNNNNNNNYNNNINNNYNNSNNNNKQQQ
ncbi:unnamed protein product [Polarella glacialis]|uniref:Tyrosine specific protein phosphatases domain-containing protein n=1 Tax=Polarella glacialis TaxID=89957 RepID=A0A813JNU6_POLGL|nr:unnamed protein product [Polarella glacialis]